MEFQHINVKLFVKNPEAIDLEALVPVFHSWIQNQGPGELLLDVADYRHVPSGPGIVLIGHEGNYGLDNADGRLGVRYNRKAALEGTNHDRLVQAARAALKACQRLESEPRLAGKIHFVGREIAISLNDRLLATNTPETLAAAEPDIRAFLSTLFGEADYTLSQPQDSRRVFSVRITSSQAFSTSELLDNLSSLAAAQK
jgi:hypothetical protein